MLRVAQAAIPGVHLPKLFLVVAMAGSMALAWYLSRTEYRFLGALRRRFVLGVPWGTLVTVLGVLVAYWVLQGGWNHPRNPVVVPFRAWSYFYPLGLLTAAFTHNGMSHIVGNLRGTILFLPIAEYAWGHYPRERGVQTFGSLVTNPFARILAVPGVIFVVGVLTSLFALGPVIGFSGVVFAIAGFAVVTKPRIAVYALLSEEIFRLVVLSLRNPKLIARARPGFITPRFADVAIQGHALGIFIGIALGLAYWHRRDDRPDAVLLWFAALVFAIAEALWAIYVPVGANEYILYRGIGVALMFVLAGLVVAAVHASERPLVGDLDISRRETAASILFAILLIVAGIAVPVNAATTQGTPPDDGTATIEVRDYTVTYVEGVENQYASVFDPSDLPFAERLGLREQQTVKSSGVVVYSTQRNAWVEAVSKGRLAFAGWRGIVLGGIGWRERVIARRTGWSVVGNGSTYKVFLRRAGNARKLAYVADPVRAAPKVDGRRVAIAPIRRGFQLQVVAGNRTLARGRIPPNGNETTVGGLTINRTSDDLYAISNETRVKIGSKQVPARQRNDG